MMLMRALMDEFELLRRSALKSNQFERAQVFDQGTSYANNTHGLSSSQVLEYMLTMLATMPTFSAEEEAARDAMIEVVEFFEEMLDEQR